MMQVLIGMQKMPGVLQIEVQPFWMHHSRSSAVSIAEVNTKYFGCPRRKKLKGIQVW
jgi:hypothetical protein